MLHLALGVLFMLRVALLTFPFPLRHPTALHPPGSRRASTWCDTTSAGGSSAPSAALAWVRPASCAARLCCFVWQQQLRAAVLLQCPPRSPSSLTVPLSSLLPAPADGEDYVLRLLRSKSPLGPWEEHLGGTLQAEGALTVGQMFKWKNSLHRLGRACRGGACGHVEVHQVRGRAVSASCWRGGEQGEGISSSQAVSLAGFKTDVLLGRVV